MKTEWRVTTPTEDQVLLYIDGRFSERRARAIAEEELDARPISLTYVSEEDGE